MRIVTISDLHLASGPLDDFDQEIESAFVQFLNGLSSDDEETELVINGDFLDFVQAEPWRSKDFESCTKDGIPLCFTEDQSLLKLENILRAHSKTFQALAETLKSHVIKQITILPGNHDADFFWPKVRLELVSWLDRAKSPTAKLKFQLEQSYTPTGFPDLWIEHGHQRDDCNVFDAKGITYWSEAAPPIMVDRSGTPRLLECVGTRFLLNFMNDLDATYPFVDNVKPFSKFVKMFLMSGFSQEFGPLKAAAAYWALAKFLGDRLTTEPRDLMSIDGDPKKLESYLKYRIQQLSKSEEKQMTDRLSGEGFTMGGMEVGFYLGNDEENLGKLFDFLATHPNILEAIDADRGLLSADEKGYMTLGAGFVADETEALIRAAREIINSGKARFVVMGHTHEAVQPGSVNYVNTGSWTRYFRQAEAVGNSSSWALLRNSEYTNFPYELAYAELQAGENKKLIRKTFRS
jgi:UDP-2,3-diacylglucosamine pyrophosphatase LpxH